MKDAKSKTFILIYLIVVSICIFILVPFQEYITVNIWFVILLIFVGAIPITDGILRLLLLKEMSNPYARMHKEFLDEMLTNGYTQKFYEIGEQAINDHINGKTINIVYLVDFVLYMCDYYNLIDQFERSYSILKLLDKKEIASRSIRYIDGSYFIVMYYAVWMEICRGTLNREMAQQIIVEGKPFLDRKYGMDAISMAADTVVYNYYILFGNFEMARRYVDKVMSYRSAQADKFVSKYYMAAEINMIFGNVDAARAILEQGKRKMGNKTAVINQVFEVFRVRLGL